MMNDTIPDYNPPMISPYYDDFYNNPFRKTYENMFLSMLIKLEVYSQYYMSDGYLQRLVEKTIIKNEAKTHKQKKMQKIKDTVRSYRASFQRFNSPRHPTCFDQTPEGDYVRSSVNCKTNRYVFKEICIEDTPYDRHD